MRPPDLEAADGLQVFQGGDVVSVTVRQAGAGEGQGAGGRGGGNNSPAGICACVVDVLLDHDVILLHDFPSLFFFFLLISLTKLAKFIIFPP